MKENNKKYSVLQNFNYCIKTTLQNYPKLILLCAAIILLNATLPIITTFLPKILIEEITSKKPLVHLLVVAGVLTMLLALGSGFQKMLDRLIYWHKFKMNTHYLKMVTQKSLTTDYCNQEDEHFRNLQSESFASCNGNFSYYAQIYDLSVSFLSNTFGFVTFLGLLLGLNPSLIVFLVTTTMVSYISNKRIVKWEEKNTDEKRSYEQKMQYITRVSGDIKAAKDIRMYNMVSWLDSIYYSNMDKINKWYKRYTSKLFKVSMVDSCFSLLREGVTYTYLLYLVFADRMTVANFVLYFNIITGFTVWLNSILGQINNISRLNISINRFRTFIEYPEKYCRNSAITIKNKDVPHTIELKNVCFRYGENSKDVLKNINLKIDSKQHLAIVGLNGAGKTTLVKLICGLIDPTEGQVLYDGIDIKEYNRENVYKLFGVVFQQFSILPVTIAEIVAEDLRENVDENRMYKCLEQAGLMSKINKLEKGVDSRYGKTMWDDGIELSGGEIQKLLLARALYKNSPIVILDEPTAALDPISEQRMYEIYDEVMESKSTLFISHRLASTRFCNQIILLENGEIIENGNHDELLKAKGRYYELFETQAKYYREGDEEINEC